MTLFSYGFGPEAIDPPGIDQRFCLMTASGLGCVETLSNVDWRCAVMPPVGESGVCCFWPVICAHGRVDAVLGGP
jgi:hypothetical protein